MELFFRLLAIALHAKTPITLTAAGEVIGESSGLFNIGLEGIMLLSAFTGAVAANAAGPLAGLAAGMGTGFTVGLLFGLINTYGKGDQMITGVGINLFALGFVAFGLHMLGAPGFHTVSRASQLPAVRTPIGSYSPIVFVALVVPFLVHFLLNRTRLGLKIKAVGENPEAADVAGIRVELVRLLSTAVGASLAGLAGAFMSVSWMGSVTRDISAGRGFIALATVVFSGLRPMLVLLGGFLFGFFDALATWLTIVPVLRDILPWQFVSMLPYIMTLLVVAGVIGRSRFPKGLGVPYRRE